jgi:hydrophobe/amphiphile efflux-1 (HAE1) family protein
MSEERGVGMRLTNLCIERPVLAWMMMLATLVFGGLGLARMGVSQYPDVDFPSLSISAVYEGAAPEIVEHDVIEPIEEALTQVEGIKAITATARQGSGSVTVDLDLERDVDAALQEVQSRLAQIQNQLPRNMDPPVISKTNPEDNPILWVGLSGPYPRQMLTDYARYRVKEKLQTLSGVGEITLGGYTPRAVRIWVDGAKLAAYGLTTADVQAALRREHVEMPAGRIETEGREINVRVLGEAMELDALRDVVVRQSGTSVVRLSDLALVEDGFEDTRRRTRIAGEPAQGIGIRKQRGANAVEVAQAVKAEVVEIGKGLPEGMTLRVMFDSTEFIEHSVSEVKFELLLAILLTSIMCWFFLGSVSSTINVVLAIPMSLMGTIAVLYFLGYTLNTFTLLGLSLAVGIVVDDAIMVLENITRHAEMGKDRVRAAREGTAQIAFAALAATIAIVAIFIPVVFTKGVIGAYLTQFGVTLSVAVLLSYVEAITLAPARCAQFLAVGHARTWMGNAAEHIFEALSRTYARVLAHTLRWPVAVVVLGIGFFVASFYGVKALPGEMVPPQDQGRFMIRLQTAVSANLDEMDGLMRQVEERVNARPEVARALAVIGGFGGTSVNTGLMFTTLVPPNERSITQQQFMQEMRKELGQIPGVRVFIQDMSTFGFGAGRSYPVDFSLRGPDWTELGQLSERVRRELLATGKVADLESDYQLGMPELRITPNRERAADLGVSMEDVGTTINALIGGTRIGKFSVDGRRVDVRMRLLAEQRRRPEDLQGVYVRARSGTLVPLSGLVHYEERPMLQSVTRKDRERAIGLFGNPAPGFAQTDVNAEIERIQRTLPEGYRIVLGGGSAAMKESVAGLGLAFALGLVFAMMVLASQFNSVLYATVVMSILPLSFTGAIFALLWTGNSLNIFSGIGIVLLMGIVKKNSIILVDYAAARQREGATALDAMLEAGRARLRPILMTSFATSAAAVPAALALGPGGEMRAPMAIAVLGGVLVSTTLSLLLVPAFYVLLDTIRRASGRLVRRAPTPVDLAG